MKNPNQGKALPPQLQYEYKYSWFRRLTWRERLFILIGGNIVVHNHWLTQHRVGQAQPIIKAVISKELTASDQFLTDNMEIIKDLQCKQPSS